MPDPLIDHIIHRERYESATARYARLAAARWRARARTLYNVLRLVEGRRYVRLREFERVLIRQPWYIKVLYVRHRRLATLLVIVRELMYRIRPRRRLAGLILRLMSRAVWRYRLTVWGEAQWKAYYITIMRFYAELYDRLLDRLLRESSAVVPLFRVYFSANWGYFEHEWLSETLARLAEPHKAEFIRAIRSILKKGLTWEQIQRMYPHVAQILLYIGYKELGLDIARRSEVLLVPKFFEDALGGLGVAFYAVYLPRRYVEPDPYIGATEPPPVQHWDYAWKDEHEPVPVKTPYYTPDSIPLLFDELGDVFYADSWRTRISDTMFEEAMALGSHGLWERVGYAVARGFFGTVSRFEGPYLLRRRGSYYLVRTVLHHLGLR